MGDANDLTYGNVLPENVRIPIIKERSKDSLLPKEIFLEKLEKLVGQKTISKKRIWHLVDLSLAEENLRVIDVFLSYFPSVEEGFVLAKDYFQKRNYSENSKGYTLN